MLELQFRKLRAVDIRGLDLAERFTAFAATRDEDGMPEVLAGWPSVAAFDGRQLVAVGGLIPTWPGRVQIWMAAAAGVRPRHYYQTMGAARFLVDLAHSRGNARVEAYVRDDMAVAHNWIERMGFEFEGLMRSFGQAGEDFRMYAHIEKGN